MPTLLEYLSTADPELDRTHIKKGSNTENPTWDLLEGTEEWADFTYENMFDMLGDILTQSHQSEKLDMPAPIKRTTCSIIDEPTVTALLSKWNHTIVDCALKITSEMFFSDTLPSMSWALGSHADSSEERAFPDWAGIDINISFPANNRVPGDSKVSGKWHTDQQHDDRKSKRDEFYRPLRQVVHYAKLFNTRYAYVISDKELVCIRRVVSEYEGSPLALNRQLRTQRATTSAVTTASSGGSDQLQQMPSTPPSRISSSPTFQVVIPRRDPGLRSEQFLTPERRTRPRQTSIASTVSAFSNMSIDSPSFHVSSPNNLKSSPSAYMDAGNPDVNEGMIHMAVIPWGENRPNQLTVNLALFWIHILAGLDIDLQSSYPSLGRDLATAYGILCAPKKSLYISSLTDSFKVFTANSNRWELFQTPGKE
jgi:hypothetical protein